MLQVAGTITVGNNGNIGTAGSPIQSLKNGGGCTGGNPDPHPCTSADDVWANSTSSAVDSISKPPLDLNATYTSLSPWTGTCSVGSFPFDNDSTRNGSRGTANIAPGSSYTCQVVNGAQTLGSLARNSSTQVVTIAGSVYIDGNISLPNSTYQGRGTIYANGTIVLSNNARLCGVANCTVSWDPSQNLLVVVAGAPTGTGFTISNNAVYQGAAYVVGDYSLANNAASWGPVIADELGVSNNSGTYTPVGNLPPGAPGVTSVFQEVPGSWRG